MKTTRWLVLAAAGLLGSLSAQADSSHFAINLLGWDDPQDFTFIGNAEVPNPADLSPCLPAGDICGDPSIRINTGGGSIPEDSTTFMFNSDQADGNGNIFFDNTSGMLINSVEITTILTPDESGSMVLFSCDGGDIFLSCGFVDPPTPNGEELDIYFYNPRTPGGGIPSAVPEPGQIIVLLLGCAALIAARSRKIFASSFFARTER